MYSEDDFIRYKGECYDMIMTAFKQRMELILENIRYPAKVKSYCESGLEFCKDQELIMYKKKATITHFRPVN